jgi:hypothetical protein
MNPILGNKLYPPEFAAFERVFQSRRPPSKLE